MIANDATVLAGTTGKVGSRKQGQIMSLAARKGYPLVMLGDANGGRLPDLLGSDFAGRRPAATRASTSSASASPQDRIPRVTAILGNAYGDPAFWAGSSDFVVMAEGCSIALSGPSLVGSSTGAATTHDDLGGADDDACDDRSRQPPRGDGGATRSRRSARSSPTCPSNASRPAPVAAPAPPATPGEQLHDIVPDRGRRGYDVRKVIDAVVDAGSFFEIHPEFARSVVVGLARVEGRPVGVDRQPAEVPRRRARRDPAVTKATGSSTSAAASACRSSSCRTCRA